MNIKQKIAIVVGSLLCATVLYLLDLNGAHGGRIFTVAGFLVLVGLVYATLVSTGQILKWLMRGALSFSIAYWPVFLYLRHVLTPCSELCSPELGVAFLWAFFLWLIVLLLVWLEHGASRKPHTTKAAKEQSYRLIVLTVLLIELLPLLFIDLWSYIFLS